MVGLMLDRPETWHRYSLSTVKAGQAVEHRRELTRGCLLHREIRIAPTLATLVEPFQRGSGRARTDHGGVGLGLAIVDTIVHAHDGTLTLTARPGGGLCVTVELGAAPPVDAGP
jgi:light-regulated signal transduction histidine kinase (bacteriophytochrome)